MDIHSYIVKLQNLSDGKKKIVLWTIVGILAVGMGFFWVKGAINNLSKIAESTKSIKFPKIDVSSNMPSLDILKTVTTSDTNIVAGTSPEQTTDWKTYANSEYGFQIDYPVDFLEKEPVVKNILCGDLDLNDCPFIDRSGLVAKKDAENFDSYLRQNFIAKTQHMTIRDVSLCYERMLDPGAGSGTAYDYYLTTKKQKCFSILLQTSYSDSDSSDNILKRDNTLKQIISSFKFIQ